MWALDAFLSFLSTIAPAFSPAPENKSFELHTDWFRLLHLIRSGWVWFGLGKDRDVTEFSFLVKADHVL